MHRTHLADFPSSGHLPSRQASSQDSPHLTEKRLHKSREGGAYVSEKTDVLVIGGGPAGLATAIAARMKGLAVSLVDGAKPPIDKVCGEGLMPATMSALRGLGVRLSSADGQALRGVCFKDSYSTLQANFPRLDGFGIRRTVLHRKLVYRAEECGANLLWNVAVTGLSDGGVKVGDKVIRANWIVGADGVHSRVRRWAGLDSKEKQSSRFAQRQHFRIQPWTDCMEIHWGETAQAYVTPLSRNEVCVSVISRNSRMRLRDISQEFAELAGRLHQAEDTSSERGAVTVTRSLPKVYKRNIALVGDASGSVDAITGEGLFLSFHQAIALADAMAQGELRAYEQEHQRIASRPRTMGRLLVLLDRHPSWRRRAFRAMAAESGLFARLLAAHLGESSAEFLTATSLRFGWQFLTA